MECILYAELVSYGPDKTKQKHNYEVKKSHPANPYRVRVESDPSYPKFVELHPPFLFT
jgi:hypothetical protein